MNRLTKYLLLLSLSCLAISCSKKPDDLGNYSDSFQFYFKAVKDGQPVEYYAGKNGYELTTTYSFEDSVLILKGGFRSTDPDNKEAFAIELRSLRTLSSPEQFDPKTDLYEGEIGLSDPSGMRRIPGEYLVTFTGENTAGAVYEWTLETGESTTGNPWEKVLSANHYTRLYAELRASSPYCESYLKKDIHLERRNCKAEMNVTGTTYLNLTAEIEAQSNKADKVIWYVDDKYIGEGETLSLGGERFLTDGDYLLSAVVWLKSGCITNITRKIRMEDGLPDLCLTSFDYELSPHKTKDPKQLGTARITYTDANGKEYTSHYEDNNGWLELAAIKSFKSNEIGQPTISFLFEGQMTLINPEDNSLLHFSECFGNMAVAHP